MGGLLIDSAEAIEPARLTRYFISPYRLSVQTQESDMGLFGWLFGINPPTPVEATKVAEVAEKRIEDRLRDISTILEQRKYSRLLDDELKQLTEDIDKVLEFVSHAISIIEIQNNTDSAKRLVTRLKNVRTRANNVLRKRDAVANQARAA